LFVSSVTQTVTGGFGWNFHGRLDLAQVRGGEILVVIRIGIGMQDRILGSSPLLDTGTMFVSRIAQKVAGGFG